MAKEKKYTWIGYDKDGNIKNELPPNFLRDIKWDLPPECKDIKKAPLSHKRPKEVAETLNAYFPKECFHVYGELVNTWLSDSSGNNIPAMREKDDQGRTKAIWVHNYIVEQLINAIENDPRISFTKPGSKQNENTVCENEELKKRIRSLEERLEKRERRSAIFEQYVRGALCSIFQWHEENLPDDKMKNIEIVVSNADSEILDELGIPFIEEGASENARIEKTSG